MQAIVTRYKGPTNTRGSRIYASTESGYRLSIPYDHALDNEGCHRKAAQALSDKLGWEGEFVSGGIRGGYAHVFIE